MTVCEKRYKEGEGVVEETSSGLTILSGAWVGRGFLNVSAAQL